MSSEVNRGSTVKNVNSRFQVGQEGGQVVGISARTTYIQEWNPLDSLHIIIWVPFSWPQYKYRAFTVRIGAPTRSFSTVTCSAQWTGSYKHRRKTRAVYATITAAEEMKNWKYGSMNTHCREGKVQRKLWYRGNKTNVILNITKYKQIYRWLLHRCDIVIVPSSNTDISYSESVNNLKMTFSRRSHVVQPTACWQQHERHFNQNPVNMMDKPICN